MRDAVLLPLLVLLLLTSLASLAGTSGELAVCTAVAGAEVLLLEAPEALLESFEALGHTKRRKDVERLCLVPLHAAGDRSQLFFC